MTASQTAAPAPVARDVSAAAARLAAQTLDRPEWRAARSSDRQAVLRTAYAPVLIHHQETFAAAGKDATPAAVAAALARGEFAGGRPRPDINLWEDVALAALLARNAPGALDVFRKRFEKMVGSWNQRYAGREPLTVDEFVADLLLPRAKSGPRIEKYQGTGPLDGWLKQTFWSICQKRREDRLPTLPPEKPGADDHADPLQQTPAADEPQDERYARLECREKLRPLIVECFAGLDQQAQLVLQLAVVDGVEQKRLAQLFGVKDHKITRVKQAAFKTIREKFQDILRRVRQTAAQGVRDCLELLETRFSAAL